FMCMESVTGGAFSGMGKTFPPSLVSVTFTAARIPLAMLLGSTALGLCGVWWSISISSILKGVIITVWFCFFLRRVMRTKAVAPV
ncbi:MAG: MATE family efflux transporter, partial [Oscillospiraceae bacterium]